MHLSNNYFDAMIYDPVIRNMFKKKEMSGGGDNVKNVFGGLFKKKDSNVAVSKSASTNAASTETNIVSKAEAAMTTPKVTTQDVFAGLFSKKDQPQPSEPKHQVLFSSLILIAINYCMTVNLMFTRSVLSLLLFAWHNADNLYNQS